MEALAVVLAGGRGVRLAAGIPKAMVALAGDTLLVRALAAVAPLVTRRVCVAPAAIELTEHAAVERVHDAGEGPLTAVVAATTAWPMARTLVMAVDLPFVDTAFLAALEVARAGAPAAAASVGGLLQPLPVWLDAMGAAALAREHAAGERSLASALRAIGVRVVDAEQLPGGAAALVDVDTPTDRAEAERRLEGQRR